MERVNRFVTQRWVLWLSLLLSGLAMAAFAWFDRGRPAGSPGVVALQLAFSAQTFQGIVEQWGPVGVAAYRAVTIYVDSWFPIAYSFLLCSLVAYLTVKFRLNSRQHCWAMIVVPFVAAALDWVENSLHLFLLRNPERPSAVLVCLASMAAATKWGLLAVTVLGIVALMVRARGRSASSKPR